MLTTNKKEKTIIENAKAKKARQDFISKVNKPEKTVPIYGQAVKKQTVKKAKKAKKLPIELDKFNYMNKSPFSFILEQYAKGDINYVYPLAVAVAISVIRQNNDSTRHVKVDDCLSFSFEEEKTINEKAPEELKDIINNYSVEGIAGGHNKTISVMIQELKEAERRITNIILENEKVFPRYKDEIKVDKKTGKQYVKTVKLTEEEYNRNTRDLDINIINQTIDGLSLDLVHEIVIFLLEELQANEGKKSNWINELKVEIVQKKVTFSEKEYISGNNKIQFEKRTYTVKKRMYAIGNQFITRERAIREQNTSYNDLLDYDEETNNNPVINELVFYVKSDNSNFELKRMKSFISSLNLSKKEMQTIFDRYYGIDIFVKDENGKKKKMHIDNPSIALLAKHRNETFQTVYKRLNNIQKLVNDSKSFQKIQKCRQAEKGKNIQCDIVEIDRISGEIIGRYKSIGQCAKETGITKAAISYVINGKRKTANNRIFQYDNDTRKRIVEQKLTHKFGNAISKENKINYTVVEMPENFISKRVSEHIHKTYNRIERRNFVIDIENSVIIAKYKGGKISPARFQSNVKQSEFGRQDKKYFRDLYFSTRTKQKGTSGNVYQNCKTTTKAQDKEELRKYLSGKKFYEFNNVKSCEDYKDLDTCEINVKLKNGKVIDTITSKKQLEKAKEALKAKGILENYVFASVEK